jgi:murein DD-endopeptidase MepM/ murein hydrolase activator NlpD
MKNLLILISILCFSNTIFGQAEKPKYIVVLSDFETKYNAKNYEAIFMMFSEEMQKALPLPKTLAYFSNIEAELGKISKREFINFVKGTFASYKTIFDKGATASLNVSVDGNSKINGIYVTAFVESNLPKIERNATKLRLPFNDTWNITWGGDTKELNYHVESIAQKNAFDIVIKDEKGKTFKTDGKTNEDYYAFGKELIAPCEGEVVLAVDGVKDNSPGDLNPIYLPGNTVIIKTVNNEYLFFAHFKNHSIVVKEGQKVRQGQLLGLCGNSGNSSEAHLHFHIQNVENMNIATGVKCYFENINVNGKSQKDYSPLKNEKISNLK